MSRLSFTQHHHKHPIILALDAVLEGCSVAILQGEYSSTLYEYAPKQQSEKILSMVQQVLQMANIRLAQVDAIAFGQGPANFTGLRISAALVQAFAYAHHKPVIGISSLQSMAQGIYREQGAQKVVVCVDAQRHEIYFNTYQVDAQSLMQANQSDCLISLDDLFHKKSLTADQWVGVGSAWQQYSEKLRKIFPILLKNIFANFQSQAQDIATLAKAKFLRGETLTPEQALPVYLREQRDWRKM